MRRSACILVALLFGGSDAPASAQDKTPAPRKKLAAGAYAVLREGLREGRAAAQRRRSARRPPSSLFEKR